MLFTVLVLIKIKSNFKDYKLDCFGKQFRSKGHWLLNEQMKWICVHKNYSSAHVLSRFSRVWLCDSLDHFLPDSSVHGILWEGILEWVAMLSSRGSSWPKDRAQVSYVTCIDRKFFTPRASTFLILSIYWAHAFLWVLSHLVIKAIAIRYYLLAIILRMKKKKKYPNG